MFMMISVHISKSMAIIMIMRNIFQHENGHAVPATGNDENENAPHDHAHDNHDGHDHEEHDYAYHAHTDIYHGEVLTMVSMIAMHIRIMSMNTVSTHANPTRRLYAVY